MSYQPPYQPPQTGYPNFEYYQPDLLAPARKAATMLYVVGGLALLGSFCCVGMGAMVPQLMDQPEFSAEMSKIPGATPEVMRLGMFISGGVTLLAGIVFIVLGIFVRKGSKGAAITALVLSILAGLGLLMNLVSSVVLSGGGATPGRMLGACFIFIPLGLVGLLIVWLVGAIKASGQVEAARYAAQYWQYQQQQQAYGGYPGQPTTPPQHPPTQAGGPPQPPEQ